jgi:uncharacterized membrane protein
MSVLWGVALLAVGFLLRINPVLSVLSSAALTAYLAHMDLFTLLELAGQNFREKRFLLLIFLVLPLIATLEMQGLREYLKRRFSAANSTSLPRVLTQYFLLRQITAAIGLTSLGGHAQSVRPLLVPIAEATATRRFGLLKNVQLDKLKAFCAGTDNVALFFGEDVFLAFSAVLLMQSILADQQIQADPMYLALWALPTGILAAMIHLLRVRRFRL